MLADASSLTRSVVYGRLWDALAALALVLLARYLVNPDRRVSVLEHFRESSR